MYFMSSIDNYSKKVWVYFIKKLKWKVKLEGISSALNLRIALSTEFLKFCEKHGTKRYFIA